MAQSYIAPAQPAHQVVWKYWGTSDNTLEREYYVALQAVVAGAIRSQLLKSPAPTIQVGREMQLTIGPYKLRARLTSIEPLMANACDTSTSFLAQYHERSKDEHQDVSMFLAEIIRYPNEKMGAMYDSLVGIKEIKEGMERTLDILLGPDKVEQWFKRHYPTSQSVQLMQTLSERYPLIVLEGAVGSGKTALARSIGHILARKLQREIVLFVVNAQVRGGGHVGELTQNISRAFDEAERNQEQEQVPLIILIDEADALAQERGTSQTHHEDDAGVNTLIQRIDRLRGRPMAVLFATNLFQSLDAAILRRAAATFHFKRPDFQQRGSLFARLLTPLGFSQTDMYEFACRTNPRSIPSYGETLHCYTYSDISQRIIPYAVEGAIVSKQALSKKQLQTACENVLPTPELDGVPLAFPEDRPQYFQPSYDFSSSKHDELPDASLPHYDQQGDLRKI